MKASWLTDLILLDRSRDIQDNVWYAFALDELLSHQVAATARPICHLWVHNSAVILGQRDARLLHVHDAIAYLESQAYKTCIRHSGGAAVPLDHKVLNISLIFPIGYISEKTYNDGFEKMYELLQAVCHTMPFQIDKGEISGAYCPGDYDLSVNGLKFCGIAQRRKVNAYIVQAFINIDGDSVARGKLIKQFYELAAKQNNNSDYPQINPEALASLTQFGSFSLKAQIDDEVAAFISILKNIIEPTPLQLTNHIPPNSINVPSLSDIEKEIKKLELRYKLQQ